MTHQKQPIPLEKLVASLELCDEALSLGWNTLTVFCWFSHAESNSYFVERHDYQSNDLCVEMYAPAPTSEELGILLQGHYLPYWSFGTGWQIKQFKKNYHRCSNEASARLMLWNYINKK